MFGKYSKQDLPAEITRTITADSTRKREEPYTQGAIPRCPEPSLAPRLGRLVYGRLPAKKEELEDSFKIPK